ncbi:hypothetical protein D3C78_1575230 [compost metagenome]
MLRDSNHYPTTRTQSLVHRMQNHFIFSDMLNDIISADNVKCVLRHYVTSVHLHELSVFPETLSRNR